MKSKLDLSIIVPLYNEQESIIPLYNKTNPVLLKLKESYEIIFVDDGSTDKSLENLRILQKKQSNIRIIVLRKNFGQSAAINAGFSIARGGIFIVIDADLQNDPDDIPKLLAKVNKGYDLVSGWRHKREDPFSKRIFSKISNWMHRRLTGLDIHDSGCSLKAYKRESVENLELYGEMHRYIPALIAAKGFKVGEIIVKHHQRMYGKSKYGNARVIKGFLDLLYIHFLTKYSSRPLHFFGYLGLLQIIAGIVIGLLKIIGLYREYIKSGTAQFGPLLLFSGILVIIGTLFVMFGFLAELMIRAHYQNAKNRNYNIKEII